MEEEKNLILDGRTEQIPIIEAECEKQRQLNLILKLLNKQI